MPIGNYNPDGTVDVYNTKTGEVRNSVRPEELGAISPNLVAEYQAGQAPEARRKRVEAEEAIRKIETGEEDVKLTEGQRTKQSLAKSGLSSLKDVESFYEEDPDVLTKQLTPGKFQTRSFDVALFGAVDALLRMRTGAAAPESEVRRYMSAYGPKFGDKPEDVRFKMDQLKRDLTIGGGLAEEEVSELFPEEKVTEDLVEKGVAREAVAPEEERVSTEELEERGFLGELTGIAGTRAFIEEAPGAALRGVVATGRNLLDIVKGDIESAKKRGEEFRPEAERIQALEKAAKAEIGTKIETIALVSQVKNFLSKNVLNRLKGVPPKDVQTVLKQGMNQVKQGSQIRDGAIDQAQSVGKKINGTGLFNKIKGMTDEAMSLAKGSQKKEMAEFVENTRRRTQGKLLNPKTLKKFWDVADDGWSSASKAGKTTEAAFHRAVRDTVRQYLDDVTGGAWEQGTRMIREGLREDKILSSLGRSIERGVAKEAIAGVPSPTGQFLRKAGGRITGGVATGLGLAAVAKMLGIGLPGAAYPE